jgi:hypothetical protein
VGGGVDDGVGLRLGGELVVVKGKDVGGHGVSCAVRLAGWAYQATVLRTPRRMRRTRASERSTAQVSKDKRRGLAGIVAPVGTKLWDWYG